MGIGYLLLYAALAVVALWLVAEVLLQNRAPLHWRALALAGFLGVAAGMVLGSVVVIGAGAGLFAVGQAFVTLSVKRGHQAGWSLRKADGSLPGPLAKVPLLGALTGGAAAVAAAAVAEPRVGEVSAVEEAPAAQAVAEDVPEVEQTAAFEMQELAQDGVYAPSYYEQQQAQQQPQDPYAAAYQSGYDEQQWQTQQQPAYAYDQQSYAGYPQQQDPYSGYQQQSQDPYAGYQQPAWDQNAQQHQQQWQPDQQTQSIPQQPTYDQNYGYQQQNTWHQG
ncbi:hypothetical protein [Streptomyces sp. FH025]|uniref:hypothetical protein n=1 Tax=Streptomyces sp. FH025 TaxID=2815937 RepID=UPI001A9E6843|nr:hypothetical protein [Streptomyces sp. FH025]MBO1419125.1 hypothetical protein [Streptomyces sp. FH025]